MDNISQELIGLTNRSIRPKTATRFSADELKRYVASGQFSVKLRYIVKLGLKLASVITLLTIVLAIPALNLYYTGTLSGNGFSDDDVKSIEDSIRKQYEEDGKNKVQNVAMIIKEPREMTGFVKIKTNSGEIIQIDCNAQLGSNKRIIWQCKGS